LSPWRGFALVSLTTALVVSGPATAAPYVEFQNNVVVGVQCDRTGPTRVVGDAFCSGFRDYLAMMNSKGGVGGRQITALEFDHKSRVSAAVESYERHRKSGAVSIAVYGTPQIFALARKLTEDRIPGTAPALGISSAADGARFPYVFPVGATYWSQTAAAVDFVKSQLQGRLRGKRIAFLFSDEPAEREPIEILEDLAEREDFQLKMFAVPPPGIEMSAQVVDIAQRFRADFVIAHLFGTAPSVSIKEFKRVGYSLRRVVSLVWGSAETNIDAAGDLTGAEGFSTMQFVGVDSNHPVLNEIREMCRRQQKEPCEKIGSRVAYNRGVFVAALHVEAIRQALRTTSDGPITGDDVKAGFEQISNFTLGGLASLITITPVDHEGGGRVQIWQVREGKLVRVTPWYAAYRDLVGRHVKAATPNSLKE
jgi:branched-chain amino acid transport system substrate-binding protein